MIRRIVLAIATVLLTVSLAWAVVGEVGMVGGDLYEVTYVKQLSNGNLVVAYIVVMPNGSLLFVGPVVLNGI